MDDRIKRFYTNGKFDKEKFKLHSDKMKKLLLLFNLWEKRVTLEYFPDCWDKLYGEKDAS